MDSLALVEVPLVILEVTWTDSDVEPLVKAVVEGVTTDTLTVVTVTVTEAVALLTLTDTAVVIDTDVVVDTAVDVLDCCGWVTDSGNAPKLGMLLLSPVYEAVMVIGEESDEDVYVTEHEADDRTQVGAGEKLATPLLAHVTIPDGEDPETAALQVVGVPTSSGEGEQLTEVAVTAFVTIREDVPEAGWLDESPP